MGAYNTVKLYLLSTNKLLLLLLFSPVFDFFFSTEEPHRTSYTKSLNGCGRENSDFPFFPESPISVSLTDENFFFKFYFCAFLNIGGESLAFDILEQLTHVERFDMVFLFMSAKEKNGMCYSLFCDMKGRF